jgi:hypothetical protein
MMIRRFSLFCVLICLCGGLLLAGFAVPRTLAQEAATIITSPRAGDTLIGVITISGTASDPNFERYRLDFALQETEEWFPITEVGQQVANGALAQWSTTNVEDGLYKIRLRVILRTGDVRQAIVENLRVQNAEATPLPTVLVASPAPATATPTVGPSPTSIIQQPPTNTQRPPLSVTNTPTAVPPAGEDTNGGGDAPISGFIDVVRRAFCNGMLIGFALFGLFFVYRVLYMRVRPRMRRMWSDVQAGGEQ